MTTPPGPASRPPSPELLAFAFTALDNGLETVIPGGGPLAPFCVLEVEGQRSLTRFPGDLEQGQSEARGQVAVAYDASFGAVVWDGYLTHGGARLDAVFVEASEAGDPRSIVLAQQYKPGGLRRHYAAHGDPVLLKRGDALIID